jgi:hypothetical protein
MYGPLEILRRALRSYSAYLRSVVTGQPFFPLVIPFGKSSMRDKDFDALRRDIAELRDAKARFTIEWTVKNDRRWGRQQFPTKVYFATEDDFLSSLDKAPEAQLFAQNLSATRSLCPELEGWLAGNVRRIVENGEVWPDILKVCRYFVDNPAPGRYIRELPIAIDTKFIQRNEGILTNLLTVLIPDFIDDAGSSFEKKFGLLFDRPLIRFRTLDEALGRRLGMAFSDLAVPVDQFALLNAVGVSVIITENKMNFLALPPLPNAIGIWGGGSAVALLSKCSWLDSCKVVYWGDIDVSGFEILARLRGMFPRIQTILMDGSTLHRFIDLTVPGKGRIAEAPLRLTPSERTAFERVMSENLMLEQERIPHDVCRQALESTDWSPVSWNGSW